MGETKIMCASCIEPEIVWIDDVNAPTFFITGIMPVKGPDPNLFYAILYEDLPPVEPGDPIRRRVVARNVGPVGIMSPMRRRIMAGTTFDESEFDNGVHH